MFRNFSCGIRLSCVIWYPAVVYAWVSLAVRCEFARNHFEIWDAENLLYVLSSDDWVAAVDVCVRF